MSKKKIMIIEDNPVHSLLVSHIVDDLKYEPHCFVDVESARVALEKLTPHLFIIDMNIQDSMNATKALIRDLRKKKQLKTIPILIISAFVTKEEIVDEFPGFDKDNVIVKPANVGDITDRIKRLLAAKKK